MDSKHDEASYNSIATVQLTNVARYVKANRSATLRLQRTSLAHSTISRAASSSSISPTPGKRTLRLSLGKKIGEGGCGLVYEATDVSLSGSPQQALPPLVVKICRNFKHYKLPIEAAIYEELEPLHGVITARYYGCFETIIRPGISFPIWDPEVKRYRYDVTERDHSNIPRVLTIIVMERLGDRNLPHGKRATKESLRDELLQIFDDLSETNIQHGDFRWANIVSAPRSTSGFRGRRCPKHGVRHKWRVIDFELSKLTKGPHWRLQMGYERMTLNLLEDIARGDGIE